MCLCVCLNIPLLTAEVISWNQEGLLMPFILLNFMLKKLYYILKDSQARQQFWEKK